jgi:hypothetical protein
MTINSLSLFVFLILICSCGYNNSSNGSEEIIELYTVGLIDEDHHAKDLSFKESFIFDKNGTEIAHHFFDIQGNLNFKEKYIFSETGSLTASNYYTATDSLLSFYKHKVNADGKKIETRSFDASNNELLRIEEFSYDDNGHLESKATLRQDLVLVRKQIFVNDAIGNPQLVRILNENEELIFEEEYRITQYDTDQKWTEKWGFRNNTPNSYRKRILNRY